MALGPIGKLYYGYSSVIIYFVAGNTVNISSLIEWQETLTFTIENFKADL